MMLHQQTRTSTIMRAILRSHVVAQSDDIIEDHGYSYFPAGAVRLDLFEKAEKSASDLECPHGVQFYDVTVDGKRHQRAAWSYERPQPVMRHIGGRFGFWGDIELVNS
jgi:uncharacterized protein (DUF427 family)